MRSDAFIVPGTGIITDGSCGSLGWPYDMFKLSLLARLCGVRVIYLSVGCGPFPLSTRLLAHQAQPRARALSQLSRRRFAAAPGSDRVRRRARCRVPGPGLRLVPGTPRQRTRRDRVGSHRRARTEGLRDASLEEADAQELPRLSRPHGGFRRVAAGPGLRSPAHHRRCAVRHAGARGSHRPPRGHAAPMPRRRTSFPIRCLRWMSCCGSWARPMRSSRRDFTTSFSRSCSTSPSSPCRISPRSPRCSSISDWGVFACPLEDLKSGDLTARFAQLDNEAQSLTPYIREAAQRYRGAVDEQYGKIYA